MIIPSVGAAVIVGDAVIESVDDVTSFSAGVDVVTNGKGVEKGKQMNRYRV